MLALYRIIQDKQHDVSHLVNMCDIDGVHSGSHGLKKNIIARQAEAIGMTIIQQETGFKDYEINFKKIIANLKREGVDGGIFGDIYLQEHRDWIVRVCSETGIQPAFPLWNNDTRDLINEFIDSGFKALVVSVNSNFLPQLWLGRNINTDFISDIIKLEQIDPCAEKGEYHSFVYDGPIFRNPVPFTTGMEYLKDNHWFLELN